MEKERNRNITSEGEQGVSVGGQVRLARAGTAYDDGRHGSTESLDAGHSIRGRRDDIVALIDGALGGDAFAIMRHGKRQAVLISREVWKRLSHIPGFGRLLASPPVEPGDLPERDRTPVRQSGL